ncbi:MAG: fumarylacetoacetate hydrolase family protein [Prevotellaceae bacterium]|jgi:2-keto-4-pentenoate hydratase/2-oxohepta-3-ene-1,7-dioic acid hydratase in catechol pathway|nr:fumarylacetoacetate hydrolase family protein [Prevotellaceae bacterium]
MKLICIPFQSHHFYLKPDTAILRDGQTFYAPEPCRRVEGAMALVAKINRLGKHISPKFAHRYYLETALGFCLYMANVLEQNRLDGAPWGNACSFDHSAPLAPVFRPVENVPVIGSANMWKSVMQKWSTTLEENPIEVAISSISQYIYLKMGDLIWIELHPPIPLSSGEEVKVFRNDILELRFSVR